MARAIGLSGEAYGRVAAPQRSPSASAGRTRIELATENILLTSD
jgi:hypothetical protein